MPEQDDIDARILAYYGTGFDEGVRLTTRSAQGPLEHRRTQEIIAAHLEPGRVVDIGGGTGVHALALRDAGHEVVLVEPVPEHVAAASEVGIDAIRGDARRLPFDEDVFDAALLLGPLYHLAERADRLQALREAARVVRSGGFVFVAGLSRHIAFGKQTLTRPMAVDAATVALLEHGVPAEGGRFPAGHFHTAEELAEEATDAGLEVLEVHGVEGPAGLALEGVSVERTDLTEAALMIAREVSTAPGVRDFSVHLLAVERVP